MLVLSCSAADTYLKLLHSVDSGASFLTWGVFECFECDIPHRLICGGIIYGAEDQV